MAKSISSLQSELSSIIEWFESADANIDQAEEKYKQGLKVVSELTKRLAETESKIKKLKTSFGETLDQSEV